MPSRRGATHAARTINTDATPRRIEPTAVRRAASKTPLKGRATSAPPHAREMPACAPHPAERTCLVPPQGTDDAPRCAHWRGAPASPGGHVVLHGSVHTSTTLEVREVQDVDGREKVVVAPA